jgi:hypothetical protein
MSHFSEGDWVDFVRGLLPAGRSTEIRFQVDRRCPECIAALTFWTRVAEFLSQEVSYSPPASVLKKAERAYASQKRWKAIFPAAQWAERIFDSFRRPAVAFVRGSRSAPRHLIYEATPFVIDLKAESNPIKNRFALVGQILDSENRDFIAHEIDVVLLCGDEVVAKTRASKDGEFALDCECQDNLQLFVDVRGNRAIGVALDDLKQ